MATTPDYRPVSCAKCRRLPPSRAEQRLAYYAIQPGKCLDRRFGLAWGAGHIPPGGGRLREGLGSSEDRSCYRHFTRRRAPQQRSRCRRVCFFAVTMHYGEYFKTPRSSRQIPQQQSPQQTAAPSSTIPPSIPSFSSSPPAAGIAAYTLAADYDTDSLTELPRSWIDALPDAVHALCPPSLSSSFESAATIRSRQKLRAACSGVRGLPWLSVNSCLSCPSRRSWSCTSISRTVSFTSVDTSGACKIFRASAASSGESRGSTWPSRPRPGSMLETTGLYVKGGDHGVLCI